MGQRGESGGLGRWVLGLDSYGVSQTQWGGVTVSFVPMYHMMVIWYDTN